MTARSNASSRRTSPFRSGLLVLALLLPAACTPKGSTLSGVYESADKEGTMTIEFKAGGKVHMTMQQSGGPSDASDGDFTIDGNKVTIQLPGGMPLSLTRNGDVLEGPFMGEMLRFTKK